MQTHGGDTMVIKKDDKYGSDFRYKKVDYEKDDYNGRCYLLDTPRSFNTKAAREGGLVRRRISKVVYEEARRMAIKEVEKTTE